MSTIPNLPALKRRLHGLQIKQATYGVSSDPSVMTEIQDIDLVIGQMERIEVHRTNIGIYLSQIAQLGLSSPPHLHAQLEKERREVMKLREACKNKGYPVQSHELDSEQVADADPDDYSSIPDVLQQEDRLSVVAEKLRDIEAMIRADLKDHALKLIKDLQNYIKN